jgi:hypothetical protein
MMLREKMEILIFALIASYNAKRQQEWVAAEPENFQFLDLQALRTPRKTSQSGSGVGGRCTCHKPPDFFDYGLKI